MILRLFAVSFFSLFDFFVFIWLLPVIFYFLYYMSGGFFDGGFSCDYYSLLLVYITFWVFIFSFMAISIGSFSFFIVWSMFFINY